jgi:hypothetical protein
MDYFYDFYENRQFFKLGSAFKYTYLKCKGTFWTNEVIILRLIILYNFHLDIGVPHPVVAEDEM